MERCLHKTLYGRVFLAHDTQAGKDVVIKTSQRARTDTSEDPVNEARIMRKLEAKGGHPNIVRFIDSVEDKKSITLIIEKLSTDLFKVVEERGDRSIPEGLAKEIFRKIVEATAFLHSNGIAHLDLSLENVLVDPKATLLKLCDFGAAREAKKGQLLKGIVPGKLNYAAPEVLAEEPFDPFAADSYSLGATLFMLLTGHPLYDLEEDKGKIAAQYASGGYKMLWQLVTAYGYGQGTPNSPSDEAISLISRLMARDPKRRIAVSDVCRHPWFKQ